MSTYDGYPHRLTFSSLIVMILVGTGLLLEGTFQYGLTGLRGFAASGPMVFQMIGGIIDTHYATITFTFQTAGLGLMMIGGYVIWLVPSIYQYSIGPDMVRKDVRIPMLMHDRHSNTYSQISDAVARVRFPGTLFGYGDLHVITADDDADIYFWGIPEAARWEDVITNRIIELEKNGEADQ